MTGLPSKTKKTYMNFIKSLPELLETAFNTHNIRKGWATAGIFPVNSVKVLGQCPRFKTLTAAQRAKIFAALPSLSKLVSEHGQLTDQQIQEAVGSAVNLEELAAVNTGRKPSGKPVHTLTLNRRRALIVNHEQVAAQIEEAEARKRGSQAQEAASSSDGSLEHFLCFCLLYTHIVRGQRGESHTAPKASPQASRTCAKWLGRPR